MNFTFSYLLAGIDTLFIVIFLNALSFVCLLFVFVFFFLLHPTDDSLVVQHQLVQG